jgi:hypothetical protein
MSGDYKIVTTGIVLLAFFLFFCGCVSMNVGEVSYSDGGLFVTINNPGQSADAFVQVTLYQETGLMQRENNITMIPVKLKTGENRVFIPGNIKSGAYKLYVYIILNGDRQTAVIRDIVV